MVACSTLPHLKTSRALFVSVLLLLLLQVNNSLSEMDSKAVSSTIANFAAKFCQELEKNKSSVSSPLSAEFLLGLLALGSTDPAKTQLLTALGLPDNDAVRSAFSSVSSKLKSIKGVTLDVANKVYLKEGPYELEPSLEKDAVAVFDAAIEKLNFGESAAAANTINKWVESKTNNRIKDLLSSDSLGDDTRLVLVNALYFKGTWSKKFDPNNTLDQPFHVNADTTIQVPMMYKESEYKYGFSEALQAQLLELPYVGGEASMVVVLPNEVEGLDDIVKKLADGHDLLADIDKMHSMKVQVSIPKFKIETEIDLAELLPKLGITAIFDQSQSGLDNLLKVKEPLYVSKAVQKAFIEVNEEGAEAAAATAGAVRKRRSLAAHVFTADRPSLWCVLVAHQVALLARHQPAPTPPQRDEL